MSAAGLQNLGDGRLRRQAALDQARRRRGLHDTILACAAGIFRATGHQHPELRRHHVQPLAGVLPDPMQLALAARADLVVDVDDDLNARQMRRQRATVAAALRSPCSTLRRSQLLRRIARDRLLDVFQAEQHLIFGQRLRPAAKTVPLQFLDDLTQPLTLAPLGEQHRFQRRRIVRQCIVRHHQIRS